MTKREKLEENAAEMVRLGQAANRAKGWPESAEARAALSERVIALSYERLRIIGLSEEEIAAFDALEGQDEIIAALDTIYARAAMDDGEEYHD